MSASYRHKKPDEGLKELLYIGEDGYFYWKDIPENKRRVARSGTFKVGGNRSTDWPDMAYNGVTYKAHRVMYWFVTGEWPIGVNHKNDDKTDYRFENLEPQTLTEKSIKPYINSKMNIKEYTTKGGEKRYVTRISLFGKTRYIGTYHDKDVAMYAAWKIREMFFPKQIKLPPQLQKFVENSF